MDRLAPASYPINELIQKRWSPRAFADKPVEPEKLRSLLEAARWAPSSSNGQPWSYIVATRDNPQEFRRLLDCLVEKNQLWAGNAPVLMVSIASNVFTHNGKPNRHAFHDVGAASLQMCIQATAMDLYVHQMGGIHPDKVRQTYSLPDTAEAVAGIALGYLGNPDTLPEEFRKIEVGPRSPRKPISDFVFSGKWGHTADWVNS